MTKFLGADGRIRDDGAGGAQGIGGLVTSVANPLTLAGQTAALAAFATETSPNDGLKHLYRVSVVITITVVGTGSINAEVTYTDDSGAARTKIIPLANTAGAISAAAVSAVDTYTGIVDIAVNPNTLITLLNAGVYTGGFAYNMSGSIEKQR